MTTNNANTHPCTLNQYSKALSQDVCYRNIGGVGGRITLIEKSPNYSNKAVI